MPIDFTKPTPKTFAEAVALTIENIDDEERKFIMTNGALCLHHNIGRDIRNEWGLWNKRSALHKFFNREYGIGHADDMSSMILEAIQDHVQGFPINPLKYACFYHSFWLENGTDPLTLKRIK